MEKFKGFYTKEKLIRIKNCDSIRLFRFSFRHWNELEVLTVTYTRHLAKIRAVRVER